MTNSFWQTLPKPILGLAPMDGITDPAFRQVVDEIGHPSIIYSEFVASEGLARNIPRLYRTFETHETNTPFIAQLFGANPESMYTAVINVIKNTKAIGIDINMGCPNKRIAHSGGGAALIKTPQIALALIQSAKEAVKDSHKEYPVSVKTRIGFDTAITEEWISTLLTAKPAAIALHGRTLKQMYTGRADWDEIRKAVHLAKQTGTLLLGNGDVSSYEDAMMKTKTYSPDGVLIGRAVCGNPWIFQNTIIPTYQDRLNAAIHHCEHFIELTPKQNPLSLRKHLAWYCKGFTNAKAVREQIMIITTASEACILLEKLKTTTVDDSNL